ncbi:pectinesterase family protein [Streptomyces sp. H27-H1]|uniref:pectinesterase family protein n=1 Tax=Streptomyces sp. H27-H1 TaxID=2996461 RepID=UPI0022712C06|nr:pectinesterase family protein [Streptomyces sp. H27-H1]MCY0925347.1 pectinesterase family protein [Streptomyces sp. H27-H1]
MTVPLHGPHRAVARRSLLVAGTGAALALTLGAPAHATARQSFGRYGSPAARLTPLTLYVHPGGAGDFTTVQSALDAGSGAGRTLVLAPGTYRETVNVTAAHAGLALIGASEDPRDVVIVYDNAAGTPVPGGGGATYGTSGSATTSVRAADFTAHRITFANDFLRADHPVVTATQAVAVKVTGDRAAFHHCRFLGHQDTLYADTAALSTFDRQYFAHCYVEGDVDFVFGRATAVFEHCRFHTLDRDVDFTPEGMVFAPSTARANPYGFLAARCRITSGAENGAYKLARPWVPSSDSTAWPSLVVRDTAIGPGIDTDAPYTDMREAYPWQTMRFREYGNAGPGAVVSVPANRPQLTAAEARTRSREKYLGDWRPYQPH